MISRHHLRDIEHDLRWRTLPAIGRDVVSTAATILRCSGASGEAAGTLALRWLPAHSTHARQDRHEAIITGR